jgi:hypothetical protein
MNTPTDPKALLEHKLATEPFKHFRCTGCGNCCRRPGLVYLTAEEAPRIAKLLPKEKLDAFVSLDNGGNAISVSEGRPCPFLIEPGGTCSIHEQKPSQCAKYPFTPHMIVGILEWEDVVAHCEGVREETPDRRMYTRSDVFKIAINDKGHT